MTGRDDLDRLRAAYREAVDGDATWVRTSEWIRRLRADEVGAMVALDQRRQEADLEQHEADLWAGKGFRTTLWAVFGRLDERREKETAEAVAAAARFAAARQRLDEIRSGAWTFDVWWDNIVSDLNMQGRIRDTAAQVEQVSIALRDARTALAAARTRAATEATRASQAATAALRGD